MEIFFLEEDSFVELQDLENNLNIYIISTIGDSVKLDHKCDTISNRIIIIMMQYSTNNSSYLR